MTKSTENCREIILWCVAVLLSACGSSGGDDGSDDAPTPPAGSGGAGAASGIAGVGAGGAAPPAPSGGASGGSATSAGAGSGGAAASSANGGRESGAAGGRAGGSSGGASAAGSPATGGANGSGGNCTIGKWPTAAPTATGPYATVTENEVGPEAGAAEDGVVPRFTLFRPKELGPNGLCHPVITWGNGTGSTPDLYRSLLSLFASHGFVVIASNSKNVAQGNPRPMLVGVTWVLEQNEDPSSVLYHRLDPTHIGATGHSQGAVATSQAAGDSRITTNVPIEGAQVQRNLHGPAMFFCGGQDEVVPCSGAERALDAVTTLPSMYAEYISADHGSWMAFGNRPSPVYAAITAWMRVHLMGDDSLRSWFYGASCTLCTDAGWNIKQKNMDE